MECGILYMYRLNVVLVMYGIMTIVCFNMTILLQRIVKCISMTSDVVHDDADDLTYDISIDIYIFWIVVVHWRWSS